MPIRPENRRLYPSNWREIATEVKRATGWRCAACGMQCRRPGEAFDTHRRTLTVAHLDHDPTNCHGYNLMAMCSGCHNRYDARHRAETRRRTRAEAGR